MLIYNELHSNSCYLKYTKIVITKLYWIITVIINVITYIIIINIIAIIIAIIIIIIINTSF